MPTRTYGPSTQRASVTRRMTARFQSRCSQCPVQIQPGDEIYYNAGRRISFHQTCPNPVGVTSTGAVVEGRRLTQTRGEFIQFVAELIMENGGIDGAWAKYGELSEFWDGEVELTHAAATEFFGAVADAIRQNSLIHPGGWAR